jgi:SAM-dependent methyltransferase
LKARPSKLSGRADVLAFYNTLPFNCRNDAEKHAVSLRASNPLQAYPPLVSVLAERPPLLDVGCGTGWLVNAAALHYRCPAHGIDFSSLAIERAKSVAMMLGVKSSFEVADLFAFRPARRFELVTSLGALHHTNDCLNAIARLGDLFVTENGRIFIGLYHAFGRRPFLEHFAAMKRRQASEEAMLAEFRRLWIGAGRDCEDELFLRSWFQDQVLHPHETCHTLADFLPVLDELEFVLESTSITGFSLLPGRDELLQSEQKLEELGQKALADGRYYPGFFVFMARRRHLLTHRPR